MKSNLLNNDDLHDTPEELSIKTYSIANVLNTITSNFPISYTTNNYILILIRKSKAEVKADNTNFVLLPNHLLILNPNQYYHFSFENNCDGIIIEFAEEYISKSLLKLDYESFMQFSPSTIYSLTRHTIDQIIRTQEILAYELTRKNEQYRYLITLNLLSLIIYNISRNCKALIVSHTLNHSIKVVLEFKKLLLDHINHSYNVQYYASLLNTNTRSLQLACKKNLGMTPKEIINENLIEEIKRKLYNPTLQIQDVAFDLGFNDASIFSNYFKKHTNFTPIEFRKSIL